MSWLLRGIQSAVFHYASCAPCIQHATQKKRRKQAKKDKKARSKQENDMPGQYAHPFPTGTNPFWQEEINLGPGPPPRRAKRSNTSSQKGIRRAGTHSTVVSQTASSNDGTGLDDPLRMSQDSVHDENWNRKRYQREDEDLWGIDEPLTPMRPVARQGSSVGVVGMTRPDTSRSNIERYYTARVPPVNDLHPPVVSLPSPRPNDSHWMLQPPPKASIMNGKERATNRSRSGSGASSRVELSLQRQISSRQLKYKLDRRGTPEIPTISRGSSHNKKRNDRPRTPQVHVRPPSAASSQKKKRRDTLLTSRSDEPSSNDSDETILRGLRREGTLDGSTATLSSNNSIVTKRSPMPNLKIVRVQSSRQRLSTVISSNEGGLSPYHDHTAAIENQSSRRHMKFSSTQSSDSIPYMLKQRTPLTSSDMSSLNVLQDLVSPQALLNSRFVSAPLMEARIRLPPSDAEEDENLMSGDGWAEYERPVPFDSHGVPVRDPRMRWSVDF
ncbi:hypothetical protein B0J11DRAFT_444115 [Dendryphion nanum]|uniref:Signal peptide-containing protein n=1 Tax=Dendryphion nanum TaxID=256645 RepID=A0A9P9DBM1_9PLEO|nr:hypothetical protein B0J11DRAFT_444115 [Dendryphion nanum]